MQPLGSCPSNFFREGGLGPAPAKQSCYDSSSHRGIDEPDLAHIATGIDPVLMRETEDAQNFTNPLSTENNVTVVTSSSTRTHQSSGFAALARNTGIYSSLGGFLLNRNNNWTCNPFNHMFIEPRSGFESCLHDPYYVGRQMETWVSGQPLIKFHTPHTSYPGIGRNNEAGHRWRCTTLATVCFPTRPSQGRKLSTAVSEELWRMFASGVARFWLTQYSMTR